MPSVLLQPRDGPAEQEEGERHVNERDGQAGETGEAVGLAARPPHNACRGPVGHEEAEGRRHPARDGEPEEQQQREEGGDALEAEGVDLMGALQPLCGEPPPEGLGGAFRRPLHQRGAPAHPLGMAT